MKICLAELKSFTKFSAARDHTSAKSFLRQFEREAAIVGIPQHQWLQVLAFVLKGANQSWFVSNSKRFQNYQDFHILFLGHHSDSATCAKLARLRSIPFNSKVNRSVESFIIDGYNAIRDLDPHASEVEVCHSLISLFPVSYQNIWRHHD